MSAFDPKRTKCSSVLVRAKVRYDEQNTKSKTVVHCVNSSFVEPGSSGARCADKWGGPPGVI
jgi:hypothetical protein